MKRKLTPEIVIPEDIGEVRVRKDAWTHFLMILEMPTGVSCDMQLIYAFAADVSFFLFDIFKKELHILYTYLYKIFVETDIS